jgi:hypothetical protein
MKPLLLPFIAVLLLAGCKSSDSPSASASAAGASAQTESRSGDLASQIGLPVYPGAKFETSMGSIESGTVLVRLTCPDDYVKVAQFYAQQLGTTMSHDSFTAAVASQGLSIVVSQKLDHSSGCTVVAAYDKSGKAR